MTDTANTNEITEQSEKQQATMSLAELDMRDYFAAKAMHALIVEPPWGEGSSSTLLACTKDFCGDEPCGRFALAAYRMADAMLAERMKGEPS